MTMKKVFLVSRPCHARERRVSSPPSRSNDFKDDLDFSSAGHGSSRFSNEYDPCPHLPLEGQKEGEEEDDDKCRGFLRGRPRATSASISSDEDLFLESQVAGGHSAEVSSSLPFEAIGGERSQVKRSRRKRRNTDDERGERERSEGEEEEEMDERMEIIEKDVAEEIERNLSENLRVTRSEVDLEGEGQKLCRSGMKLLPPDLYEADTCALCYHYMRNTDLFVNKWKSVDAERNSWEGDTTRVYTINVLETPEGSLLQVYMVQV
nr:uncharacterized protein LOC113816185 [Penaeus vannamei]